MNTLASFSPSLAARALRPPPLRNVATPSSAPFRVASRFQPRPQWGKASTTRDAAAVVRDYLASPQIFPDAP